MASRILLLPTSRALLARNAVASPALRVTRSFQTTSRLMETPVNALPARRPVGAFRGGMFGFLLGAVSAGGAMYYYVVDEYRVSNELLTEDIYALQAAVSRIENYVKVLEDKVGEMAKNPK